METTYKEKLNTIYNKDGIDFQINDIIEIEQEEYGIIMGRVRFFDETMITLDNAKTLDSKAMKNKTVSLPNYSYIVTANLGGKNG